MGEEAFTTPPGEIPWESIAPDLGEVAASALEGVLEGAAADLQIFASEMIVSLGAAQASGDPERVTRIREQFKILGEAQRLTANRAGWELALVAIDSMVQAAAIGARAVGGSAQP